MKLKFILSFVLLFCIFLAIFFLSDLDLTLNQFLNDAIAGKPEYGCSFDSDCVLLPTLNTPL